MGERECQYCHKTATEYVTVEVQLDIPKKQKTKDGKINNFIQSVHRTICLNVCKKHKQQLPSHLKVVQ